MQTDTPLDQENPTKNRAIPPTIVREALRISASKPNVAAGVRAAMAATLPLVLVPMLGMPALTWASLAGFNTVMVDKGGAYRTRLAAMSGYAAVAAVTTVLATLTSTHPALAIALVLVAVTAFGLMRLFGAAATSVGISSAVALVIALAVPSSSAQVAFERGAFGLAGSAWALVFSLLLWPIRPYRPARLAVAAAYRELATLSAYLQTASADFAWQAHAHELAVHARLAIENGRATLGALRRGRPGSSLRGEQLVVLLEGADQLFGDLVAVKSLLDRADATPEERGWARATAERVGLGLSSLAKAIETEQAEVANTANTASAASAANVPGEGASRDPDGDVHGLRRAAAQLAELERTARALDGTRSGVESAAPREPSVPELLVSRVSPLATLRAQLTRDSAILRHALRMSISTAVAVLLTSALHVHRGYWTTLTCLVILQPHGSQTLAKALQRVGGTVAGAWIAIVVAAYVHDPMVVLGCVFVLIAIAVALMPINYAMFALFLTPSFVLLAERSSGEPGLARVRVVNTLVGAAIALVGSRLLFPLSERDRLRPQIATALRALRRLLDAAVGTAAAPARTAGTGAAATGLEAAGGPAPPSVAARKMARRDVGLALSNADASFQRALTESAPSARENEALLTLILYAHRIAAALNGVARAERPPLEALAPLGPALDDLVDAIGRDRLPGPMPPFEGLPDGLRSDFAILHDAALRWHAARHA